MQTYKFPLPSKFPAATESRKARGIFIIMENEIWKDVEGYEGLYQVSNLGRVKSLDRTQQNHSKVQSRPGRIMHLQANPYRSNYVTVILCKDARTKRIRLNRLVAMTFIPIPEKYAGIDMSELEVDHISGDVSDNSVSNLRWFTKLENNQTGMHRNNVSKAMKGRFTGEKAYWYGKHHSDETRRKISLKNTGKPSYMKGKHHTAEARIKMSEARKGGNNWRARKVYQCDKDWNVIAEWGCARDAERAGQGRHSGIGKCCKGEVEFYHGYRWRY